MADIGLVSGDDFIWHVRLEGDQASRQAGAGARQKAAEEAAKKGRVRAWLDRVVDVHDDERAWRRGAQGEEQVGRRLLRLERHGWTVVHDLTIGSRGANLDHLAIGPGGVFALNTKNHRGKKVWVGAQAILVNGHKTDYLASIVRETAAAEKALRAVLGSQVMVRGVIVVLADQPTVREQPAAATVVAPEDVAQWLRRQRAVLAPEFVAVTARAARLPSTWGTAPRGGVLDQRPASSAIQRSRMQEQTTDGRSPNQLDADEVVVRRWRRYGKDRLYVSSVDGQRLGYLDCLSGEMHIEPGADPAEVQAAVQRARRSRPTDR